jgi:ATP-binding cassette, subfamily C (CFTR/MRP), member 1
MQYEAGQQSFLSSPKLQQGEQLFVAKHQPLCGDPEGWGPLSPLRYDFTPCFLDVWIIFVAAWGVVCGAAALWYLFKKRAPQEVSKNWHFYAKLVWINKSS